MNGYTPAYPPSFQFWGCDGDLDKDGRLDRCDFQVQDALILNETRAVAKPPVGQPRSHLGTASVTVARARWFGFGCGSLRARE